MHAVAPGEPTDLDIESIEATQATLCWQAPQDIGQPGIAFYTITATDTANPSDVITANTATNSTTYTMTGLLPNIAYEFRVQAVAMVLDVESPSGLSLPGTGTTDVTG